MRAWAVFMMIQGHSIDALLSNSFYNSDSTLFNIWLFNRGLTAPIFLFGAGFAYVFATFQKMQGQHIPLNVVFRRLRWIAVLFLLGALMHLPAGTFGDLANLSAQSWKRFFHVDVLRLMAVTLLLLFGLFMLTRSRKRLMRLSLLIALLLIAAAPFTALVDWTAHLPLWAAAFMNTKTGSWFPIFPYSAFIFLGAAAGSLYLRWHEQGIAHKLPQYYFIAALLILIVSFLPRLLFPGQLPYNQGAASIWLSFSRLGWVLLLWAGVGFTLRNIKSVPNFLAIAGQHSLFIYVSHIVVLYGSAWMPGLRQIFGKTLDFPPVLAVILILMISTTWVAYGMHQMKTRKSVVYRYAPYAAGIVLMTLLVFA